MRNKQHEYILKSFLASSVPIAIRRASPELMAIDSVLGGYCTQLVKNARSIALPSNNIISRAEKDTFAELINRTTGLEKDELLVYYRLIILVETILTQYRA